MNFASGFPMLVLTMFGGVLADRYDKRLILLATLTVQAALAVAIGLLVGSGHIALWHVIAAGVGSASRRRLRCRRLRRSCRSLSRKAKSPRRSPSIARSSTPTRLAGPALGGWLIGALGTASAFYANALSFSALMLALVTIRPRPPGDAARRENARPG